MWDGCRGHPAAECNTRASSGRPLQIQTLTEATTKKIQPETAMALLIYAELSSLSSPSDQEAKPTTS